MRRGTAAWAALLAGVLALPVGCGVHAGAHPADGRLGVTTATDDAGTTSTTAGDPAVLGSTDPSGGAEDPGGSNGSNGSSGSTGSGPGFVRSDYLLAVIDSGTAPSGVDPSSVQCLAAAIVDGVGATTLSQGGVTPTELVNGRFVKILDWSLDDIAAYSAAVGTELDGCPIVSDLMVTTFANRFPGATFSQETRTCIDTGFSRPVADSLVKAMIDRNYDANAAGAALAPSLLAGCTSLATEITIAELNEAGVQVNTTAATCLRIRFDAAAATDDSFSSADIAAVVKLCRAQVGF